MAYEYDRFDDETSGGGFMLGLMGGAVLGAGLGMLLAPKPGAELRGQLGTQASRLRTRASEGYATASEKVSSLYNRAQTAASSTPATPAGTMGSTAGFPAGTSGYQASGVDRPADRKSTRLNSSHVKSS